MTKQQLIEYLDAVCDAECAVQALSDEIKLYHTTKEQLHEPHKPIVPNTKSINDINIEHIHFDYFSVSYFLKSIGISLSSYVAFCLLLTLFLGINSLGTVLEIGVHTFWLFFIFGFSVLPIRHHFLANKSYNDKYSSAKDEIRHQNEITRRQYELNCYAYQQSLTLFTDAVSQINTIIEDHKRQQQSAHNTLAKLYSHNILYPSFQNLIAAYQIREYLQMGICDTLEGPTGAYAQYMNDVRTARICDSITDLKRSLTSAIHGLQGTLARELQQIDSNLDSIRSEMSTSMNSLASQMQQMQNASSAHLDAHFNEANRQLRTLNENVAIAEHNRYIERRLQNVDTYLMKLPKSS